MKELVARGRVVVCEAHGPYALERFHGNIIGRIRGYSDEAAYEDWIARNKAAMARQKSWESLDLQDLDPDWVFQYGEIDGQGMDFRKIRPFVEAAQEAMSKEYAAAYEKAKAIPEDKVALDHLEKERTFSDTAFSKGVKAQHRGVGTVLELYAGALRAISGVWRLSEAAAASGGDPGGTSIAWSLKKPQRIWYKLHNKYNGNAAHVTDTARTSIIFASCSALEKAARFLLSQKPTGFKNRIATPTDENYRDILFNFMIVDHICEVQLHMKQMANAKKGESGHKLYKLCRRVLRRPQGKRDVYDGDHNEKGLRNGVGRMSYGGGDEYSGQWRDGKRHGKGTFYQVDGSKYEGEFAMGSPDGEGTYSYASGDRYEGEFRAGILMGHGTYLYASGNRYEGQFANDLPAGEGKLLFASGNVYEGQFVAGKREGQGKIVYTSKDKYVGEWQASQQHGIGIYYFAGGSKFHGHFVDNKKHGIGVHYNADGSAEVSAYKCDKMVGESVAWSTDRNTAWRVVDGHKKPMTRKEAGAKFRGCGIPLPS